MMDWSMVITIAGAACLAKSLMDLVERLDRPGKGAKKDRAAAANNCTVSGHTR